MSEKAHELTDAVIALPPSDRDAVLLTLRAFDKSIATLTKLSTSSTPAEDVSPEPTDG